MHKIRRLLYDAYLVCFRADHHPFLLHTVFIVQRGQSITGLGWHDGEYTWRSISFSPRQIFLCGASGSDTDAIFPPLRCADDIWARSHSPSGSIHFPSKRQTRCIVGRRAALEEFRRRRNSLPPWGLRLSGNYPAICRINAEVRQCFPHHDGTRASDVIFTLGCVGLLRCCQRKPPICLSGVPLCVSDLTVGWRSWIRQQIQLSIRCEKTVMHHFHSVSRGKPCGFSSPCLSLFLSTCLTVCECCWS